MNDDRRFLAEAYKAALAAVGNSDPNPAVGAVIVSEAGKIIARGSTQRAGHAHAERAALDAIAGADLTQATLYVTLEPCCHHGRTPPCVDAVLARKLRRVVIAERDFAAEVMGRSVQMLREHQVEVSVLEEPDLAMAAWFTTGPFFFSREHARPRITLKWAQTFDGALAPVSGPSGPISGKEAAELTAALRSYHKLTLATPGAVRLDKPRLNVRFTGEPSKIKSAGFTPLFADLLVAQQTPHLQETAFKPAMRALLNNSKTTNPQEIETHQQETDTNFRLFDFNSEAWHENFLEAASALFKNILAHGYNSILVEAGPIFSELLIRHNLVDVLAIYRSHEKTATALWGAAGRENSISHLLAHGKDAAIPNFELIEQASFSDDEFLLFRCRNQ